MLNNFNALYFEYTLGVLFSNVIIYLLSIFLFSTLLFCFDLNFFRSLNELKNLGSYIFLLMSAIIIILSMAGIPPMAGFTGKFLLSISLLKNNQFYLFFLFTLINLFMIYFYVQNTRLLQKKSVNNVLRIKSNYAILDFRLIYLIVILNFFNFFIFFYVEDLILVLNFITSHIRFG